MLIERLALKVAHSGWEFDQILCLARGGMRPGDVLSRVFDKPLAIMSTSSYRAEAGTIQGRLDMAKYITMPKGELAGRVLLVDDLADSGVTLRAVVDRLRGVPSISELRTAVLWVKGVSSYTPEYYVEQALKYFDTLDISADPESIPVYSELVARWEWPPWLLLTGWGRENLVTTASALRQLDPSTVPERDCRFFPVQPFARCYIVFEYEEGLCPIYEEFVFNDAGEMTFIEAWSDVDGLRPTSAEDRFGERPEFNRLSTRMPGLGKPDGRLDLDGPELAAAAETDPDIANFLPRARDFWGTWAAELGNAPDDFFAKGCGWPAAEE
jgi:hypoxanthine phosphoribosyltransferase